MRNNDTAINIDYDNWIEVYPTLTNDLVTLKTKPVRHLEKESKMQITLLTINGQLLSEFTWGIDSESKYTVDLSSYPRGTYLINCKNGLSMSTYKIQKI